MHLSDYPSTHPSIHHLLPPSTHPAHPAWILPPPRAHDSEAPGLLCQRRNELYCLSHLFLLRNPAARCCVEKNFQGGVTAAPPARLHLRTRAVKLDSNCINGGLCLPVGFFILSLSLSLSAHFTRFKGRKEEEGKKSSSLRVCGLASFMSCDHGCPSLH